MADSNLDFTKTRYTHRDYDTLRKDLISIIPSLTQKWTSTEEADPGIVLIKLIAMMGDNLSYNIDKIALETYIESVSQRKNCRKILALLGYKMGWYRSAKVTATVRNVINSTDPQSLRGNLRQLIPWETTFKYGSLQYIMVSSSDEDTNILELYPWTGPKSIQLVEGVRNTAKFTGSNLKNNRFYFNKQNIDEFHMRLLQTQGDSLVEVGKLVNNLYLVADDDHLYFEFNVDEYGTPYIELVDTWRSWGGENAEFTLQYIATNGSKGNVPANAFEIRSYGGGSFLYISNLTNDTTTSLDPYNSPGQDPENCDEARKNSANWVFTYDTLVSKYDFEKAARRAPGVYNSKLVDGEVIKLDNLDMHEVLFRDGSTTTDPHVPRGEFQDYCIDESTEEVAAYRMTPYIVIMYVIHQDFTLNEYCGSLSEEQQEEWYNIPGNAISHAEYVFDEESRTGGWTGQYFFPYKPTHESEIKTDAEIYDNKIMNVELHYGTTKVFPFKVAGTLHFIEPLDPVTILYLVDQAIPDALKLHFRPDNRSYGQKPTFLEIVEVIQNSDDRIYYFDAETSLIQWVIPGDPPVFDTTSFAKYQGLATGDDGFKVDAKFLRFYVTNKHSTPVTLEVIPQPIPDGKEYQDICEPGTLTPITLAVGEKKYIKCENIPQLRTLQSYIDLDWISCEAEGGVQ